MITKEETRHSRGLHRSVSEAQLAARPSAVAKELAPAASSRKALSAIGATMYWLTGDLFASLPEHHGYVPLGPAFAQFVAVECDEDPLDRQGLREMLGEASAVQEVMRWMQRLLQTGELKAISRPFGGGAAAAIPPSHWQADDVLERFLDSRYAKGSPFDPKAEADCWIFVDGADLERIWNERAEARLGQHMAPAALPSRTSPRRATAAAASVPSGAMMLSLAEVEAMVGLRKSTIYKMIEDQAFPEQVRVGGRALWRRSEIEGWVESLGKG